MAFAASKSWRLPLAAAIKRAVHNKPRIQLLNQIYAPFSDMDPKSPEYNALGKSGKCWEQYFDPGNAEKHGYTALQRKHSALLLEINSLRLSIEQPIYAILESLVAEYAHQSVAIENNKLNLRDSIIVRDALENKVFDSVDMRNASTASLRSLSMPTAQALLQRDSESQVAELRNHILVSQWVTTSALRKIWTEGLSEEELCDIAAIMVQDTDGEALYTSGWGEHIKLGQYRRVPIQVKSNPLRIFPYPQEVPALMQNYLTWRKDSYERHAIHPLILSCHSFIYFVFIHPFVDGNGRVGRTLLQHDMIRHGFFPIVMQGLDRKDYLQMVSDAQDGKPDDFVEMVLLTQLDMLRTFRSRDS